MNAPKVKHCGTSLKTFKTDFLNDRMFTELIIHRWISITAGFIRFFILGLNPHPIFLPHIVICRNTLTLPCRRLFRNLSKSLTRLTAWITLDGVRNIILGFNLDLNVKFSFQICLHLYHWLLDKLAMFLLSCNSIVLYFCLFCVWLIWSVWLCDLQKSLGTLSF